MSNHHAWTETLDSFNRRNSSHRMDLEIMTPGLGAQSEVHGMILRGVTYDPRDEQIEIMLAHGERNHITHAIGGVTSVDVLHADGHAGDVLRIEHADGQSLLRPTQVVTPQGAFCAVVR